MTPVRIQRQRTKGWRMPRGAVYVGRPTRWGNQFRVNPKSETSQRVAVSHYRHWVTACLREDETFARAYLLELLRGRDLACWCPLDQPCHADVLLELANRDTWPDGSGDEQYDTLPFLTAEDDWPPAVEREPRKCSHPKWKRTRDGAGGYTCDGCGHVVAAASLRRGKSSRRLGGDQERRIERLYGPTKIGERGDPVDHLGRIWRWQSKATRGLPPRWLAAVTEPMPRAAIPAALGVAWAAMDGHYGDRAGVVIRSFVARGVGTRDWLFVAGLDAANQFGLAPEPAWYVVPGSWWLDHFGRDDEGGTR